MAQSGYARREAPGGRRDLSAFAAASCRTREHDKRAMVCAPTSEDEECAEWNADRKTVVNRSLGPCVQMQPDGYLVESVTRSNCDSRRSASIVGRCFTSLSPSLARQLTAPPITTDTSERFFAATSPPRTSRRCASSSPQTVATREVSRRNTRPASPVYMAMVEGEHLRGDLRRSPRVRACRHLLRRCSTTRSTTTQPR